MISCEDISFSYERKLVFEHLTFSVNQGQVMAILGPNGAGKTTFLRTLIRALKLDGGDIYLDQKPIKSYTNKEFFKKVAYVPQVKHFTSSFTVTEMVLLGLTGEFQLFGAPKEEDVKRVEDLLLDLGIAHLKDKSCDALSGGELQMVVMARAMIKNPDIFVLDEPESGLDFRNQLIVLNMIQRLKQAGKCIIFNTHYPVHALKAADQVLLLFNHHGIFGNTDEILTEEHLREAFQVETYKGEFVYDGKVEKTIVPMKLL